MHASGIQQAFLGKISQIMVKFEQNAAEIKENDRAGACFYTQGLSFFYYAGGKKYRTRGSTYWL
jgi:hypothetical protein